MRKKIKLEKKNLWVIALLYLLPFWVKSQEPIKQPFSLKGKIYGKKSGTIYINGRYNGVNDSCKLRNGRFAFKGFIAEPSKITFTLNPKFGGVLDRDNETEIYIEPANMDIAVHLNDFRHIKLTGSVTDKDRVTLDKAKEKLDDEIRPLNIQNLELSNLFNAKKREGADPNILIPVHNQLDSVYQLLVALLHKKRLIDSLFIIQHPASYVTLNMLWTVISFDDIQFPSIEKLYNQFPEKIQQGYLGRKIWNVVLQQRKTEIGALIDNFISLDMKGDTIELHKYKNKKYVLLDFWASWCAPCRIISPILSEYHYKYKNNLEVISISIDKDKIAWSKAIDADKMVWAQILNDEHPLPTMPKTITIADSYHLTTIPVLILIDKDSKIRGNFDGSKSSLDKLDTEIKKLKADVAQLY